MSAVTPDEERFILHLDVDCFYSQVEELRNPSYANKPLAVTQKYLIVTCNYPARALGISKLMSLEEAKKRCPSLILVPGEDLTPYRQASKRILAVVQRFGPAEKLGMDETYVDLTPEVRRRIASGQDASTSAPPRITGHVYTRATAVRPDTTHRTQDLRAVRQAGGAGSPPPDPSLERQPWWRGLCIASTLAKEIRDAIFTETGFRCSGGIGCNKLAAKLASGMHKPNDQTACPPSEVFSLIQELPVRSLPGLGFKTDQVLSSIGVHYVKDLHAWTQDALTKHVGPKVAALCCELRNGKDASEVVPKGPPKAISVEDSFSPADTWVAALAVIQVLAPDLVHRMDEDHEDFCRTASQLCVKYRVKGMGWNRTSLTLPMPYAATNRSLPLHERSSAIAASALSVLQSALTEPLQLTLLNLGATGFKDAARPEGGALDKFLIRPAATATAAAAPQAQGGAGDAGPSHNLGAAGGPLVEDPVARAQRMVMQRRSYSGLDAQTVISKSAERALREQGHPFPTATAAAPGPSRLGGASSVPTSSTSLPLAPRHPTTSYAPPASPAPDDPLALNGEDSFWQDLQEATIRAAPAGTSGRNPAALLSAQSLQLQPPPGYDDSTRLCLHCDVDSFYVACERLDDPSLVGKPIAVRQFNAGGFVAVSYEARAHGVRCGDGVGAGGRAEIPHLLKMQAVSEEEAKRRCPGLLVLPMRVDRYRAIATELFAVIKEANQGHGVEKTSYDDFYLNATWARTAPDLDPSSQPPPPEAEWKKVAFAGEGGAVEWSDLHVDLQRGVLLALRVKAGVARRFGTSFTLSIGVARNKLLARVVGPLNKPDGLTVLPDGRGPAFVRSLPLRSIPIKGLRAKAGEDLAARLPPSVLTVGDLASVDLRATVGPEWAVELTRLYHAQDPRPVEERGPPKSIVSERSFPPMHTFAEVQPNLLLLAEQLVPRIREDQKQHGVRQPAKLIVSYRIGFGGVRSKSGAFPGTVTSVTASALCAASLSLLKSALAPATTNLNLTRLVITLGFPEGAGPGTTADVREFFSMAGAGEPGEPSPRAGGREDAGENVEATREASREPILAATVPAAVAPVSSYAAEIKALQEALALTRGGRGTEEMDPDVALALKLQQEELGLATKRPAQAAPQGGPKGKKQKASAGPTAGVRPLTSFFPKTAQ